MNEEKRQARNRVRFWKFVKKTNGCWLWTGSTRGSNGYGQFCADGKQWMAHRYSFFLHTGRMPTEFVLHKCNEPLCVRPSHWEEGDGKRNLSYAASLGRMAHGSRNGSAKLTEEQVRDIFRRYKAGGVSQQLLANEHGVSQPMVSEIVLRTKWQRATEGL